MLIAVSCGTSPIPPCRTPPPHLEPQPEDFCPDLLRKVLLQLLHHLLRVGKLEFAWGPLLNPSPELHTWERPNEVRLLTLSRGLRPALPRLTHASPPPPRAPTHCCRPGAAASPRSCPSGAWQGSPPLEAPGPPGAAPGSGPRRCAHRRVNSCYGEMGRVRGWVSGAATPLPPSP